MHTNTWIAGKDLIKHTFYSSLNMEGITNVDQRQAKRAFKYFYNKYIPQYIDMQEEIIDT